MVLLFGSNNTFGNISVNQYGTLQLYPTSYTQNINSIVNLTLSNGCFAEIYDTYINSIYHLDNTINTYSIYNLSGIDSSTYVTDSAGNYVTDADGSSIYAPIVYNSNNYLKMSPDSTELYISGAEISELNVSNIISGNTLNIGSLTIFENGTLNLDNFNLYYTNYELLNTIYNNKEIGSINNAGTANINYGFISDITNSNLMNLTQLTVFGTISNESTGILNIISQSDGIHGSSLTNYGSLNLNGCIWGGIETPLPNIMSLTNSSGVVNINLLIHDGGSINLNNIEIISHFGGEINLSNGQIGILDLCPITGQSPLTVTIDSSATILAISHKGSISSESLSSYISIINNGATLGLYSVYYDSESYSTYNGVDSTLSDCIINNGGTICYGSVGSEIIIPSNSNDNNV